MYIYIYLRVQTTNEKNKYNLFESFVDTYFKNIIKSSIGNRSKYVVKKITFKQNVV